MTEYNKLRLDLKPSGNKSGVVYLGDLNNGGTLLRITALREKPTGYIELEIAAPREFDVERAGRLSEEKIKQLENIIEHGN